DGFNEVHTTSGSTITSTLLNGQGLDERYARTQGGSTETFLTDALGSTVNLVNAGGALTANYVYEPYGQSSQSGSSDTQYRYTGREDDGTGLMYYRARYYNPRTSRFISEDPIGLAGGYNLYGYVGQEPVGRSDPSGLAWIYFSGNDREAGTWEIVSSDGPTGHAWVTVFNDDGTTVVSGNYPGGPKDDSARRADTASRAWWIPQKSADAIVRDLVRRHYSLWGDNCVDRARQAADAAGVPTPARATTWGVTDTQPWVDWIRSQPAGH
ncbi:MAG: hypothetical protein GC151_04050, partial [Betaproteobacteria bacterium]|nr:hypothetical protein [Betaproteobacteria bacterium]